MKWNWKEWAVAALIRAVKTFAQCFAACCLLVECVGINTLAGLEDHAKEYGYDDGYNRGDEHIGYAYATHQACRLGLAKRGCTADD